MNFNEKLINLRKSKGMSQEELGAELKVSRQTVSKWESGQSYPDFQRLVLLSDYFGLTLDELVKGIDVQEVREKNINNDKINSIYNDVNTAMVSNLYLKFSELQLLEGDDVKFNCGILLKSKFIFFTSEFSIEHSEQSCYIISVKRTTAHKGLTK